MYVGEAEDCAIRLQQHNKTKDWWSTALVCVSKTQDFTKSHVKYLEWFAHREVQEVGRFKLDNGSIPTKSFVPEPVIADLMDHFNTLRILVSTLGFPLFDRIPVAAKVDRLICKGKKAAAHGEYVEDGFVVFAGSIANKEFTPSTAPSIQTLRESLLADGVLIGVDDETIRFSRDHVFQSPSQAASMVLARSANGWAEWKYPDGRTLDEVKRRS